MMKETVQQQIDKFKLESGVQLEIKDGKPYYDEGIYLGNKTITIKIDRKPTTLVVG